MRNHATAMPNESCRRFLPYRTEVTFRLATDTVSVTVRSRRLSFFDKVSGFGEWMKHQILGILHIILTFISNTFLNIQGKKQYKNSPKTEQFIAIFNEQMSLRCTEFTLKLTCTQ